MNVGMKRGIKTIGKLLFLSFSLTRCAVGPDFHPPESPNTEEYENTFSSKSDTILAGADQEQRFLKGADIPQQWWELFHCKALNELIERGFIHSKTVLIAQAALRAAQEDLKAEIGTDRYPQVDFNLGYERQRASNASTGSDTDPVVFNLYNVSVGVSYTPDFFGSSSRKIEGFIADVETRQFEIEATYLTLAANIVTSAITEASLRAQIQATKNSIGAQEEIVNILQKQLKLGGVSQQDVLTQQDSLQKMRASLPPLEHNLSQVRNALAVLVGTMPNEKSLPTFTLEDLHLPADLPLSIPSKLVHQRPDIRVAEAHLHKASAQVGVAIANLYPTITLSGNYGSLASNSHNLFNSVTTIWSFGAQLLQPIFHGGALTAKKEAAVSMYKKSLALYQHVVLQAFQNVADTLYALEYDAQKFSAQKEAETIAQNNLDITKKQFDLGAVAYGALLNAQIQYQQATAARVQAEAARYNDTAALFQALGGGWWNRDNAHH